MRLRCSRCRITLRVGRCPTLVDATPLQGYFPFRIKNMCLITTCLLWIGHPGKPVPSFVVHVLSCFILKYLFIYNLIFAFKSSCSRRVGTGRAECRVSNEIRASHSVRHVVEALVMIARCVPWQYKQGFDYASVKKSYLYFTSQTDAPLTQTPLWDCVVLFTSELIVHLCHW